MAELCEREAISKTLTKYIDAFDNFDKNLLVLSAASVSVSISPFVAVTGAQVRIAKLKSKFGVFFN